MGRGLDPRVESGLPLGIGSKLLRRDEAKELLGRLSRLSRFRFEAVGSTLERRAGCCFDRLF